jgi:titin
MISRRLNRVWALIIVGWMVAAASGCSEHPTSPETVSLGVGNNALGAPSGVTAVASSPSQIDVAWTDNSSGESGFEVHSAGTVDGTFSLLTQTGANVTTAGFPDVGYSVPLCYRVRAFATVGKKNRTYSGFSNTACATTPPPPPTPPAAPRGTMALSKGSTVMEVRWIDDSSDEDGFRVERSPSQSCTAAWEQVASTGPNITSVTDAGRVPEQWLCYRVIAFKNTGAVSPPSPVSVNAPIAAPSNLGASAVDHRSIQLTWADNSGFEYSYEVHRAVTAGGPYERVGWMNANATGYTDPGLTSSTTYWYRVRASGGGVSDFSNETFAITQPLPPPAPPVAPTDVNAAPYSSSEAYIRWWDHSWNETGFRIEHSLDAGATWALVGSAPPDSYEAWVGGGTADRRNCYRVVAFNDLGESASPGGCTTLIAGPLDATVRPDGLFQWKDQSGFEDGYEIWYCGPEECAPLYSVPANTESFADQWYYEGFVYWVVGLKDGGFSDPAVFSKLGGLTTSTAKKPISIREYLARSTRRLPVKKP